MKKSKMENGYEFREDEKPWYDERFHAPREQSIKRGYGLTMDNVKVVDHSQPDYPKCRGIFKLHEECHDLVDGILEELKEHIDFVLSYREGYRQKRDRFMVVYPSGDNHRVKNVSPNRYDVIKNYDDKIFGKGVTVMTHLPTGTWVYFHENKEAGSHVNELVDRLLSERVDMRGEDREDYTVEMAMSFKGAKTILGRHRDHDDDNNYKRYHAVLKSNSKNYIATGETAENDYVIAPKTGEIWTFSVDEPHWAGNDASGEDDWSLHLVVDIIKKQNIQQGEMKIDDKTY
tara:strand:- start:222 stop:1085 length:864 start_codon:yes stop_codon:yes gene_type:complete